VDGVVWGGSVQRGLVPGMKRIALVQMWRVASSWGRLAMGMKIWTPRDCAAALLFTREILEGGTF